MPPKTVDRRSQETPPSKEPTSTASPNSERELSAANSADNTFNPIDKPQKTKHHGEDLTPKIEPAAKRGEHSPSFFAPTFPPAHQPIRQNQGDQAKKVEMSTDSSDNQP